MSEQIFILTDENKLVELNEQDFIDEDQFQKLLEEYPALLAGSRIDPGNPRKWLLVAREFGVPDEENSSNRWALDHLFIDQDGIPTLVEVKRKSDSRLRREVVGQMLDYAANAVSYWSIEEIKNKFETQCREKDKEPEFLLADLIGNDADIDKFWDMVEMNLKAGRIRMIFVADMIPKELQRIIEFLNEQMKPAEVLGLEIKQFAGTSLRTLVPRIVGLTANAEIKKSIDRKQWTRESFFSDLERKKDAKIVSLVEELLAWIRPKVTDFWYGKGKTMGSIVPFIYKNKRHQLFAFWSNGSIELYFQYYKEKLPFSDLGKREELFNKLNAIDGIAIPREKINKRPSFNLEVLLERKNRDAFKAIFEWVIKEINKDG